LVGGFVIVAGRKSKREYFGKRREPQGNESGTTRGAKHKIKYIRLYPVPDG